MKKVSLKQRLKALKEIDRNYRDLMKYLESDKINEIVASLPQEKEEVGK